MYSTENLYTVSVSAPGKVILHGEHSVVYGKVAIATSLGLRSSIVLKEVRTTAEASVHVQFPAVGLQEWLPLEPIVHYLFNPQLAPGISGKFSWKLPGKLDHDHHLRKVEDLLHIIRPDFDALEGHQKNSLRCFLYIFSGIFGSANMRSQLQSLDITMGSELTIGAGTGSSASFAVCLAGALIQLLKLKSSGGDQCFEAPSGDFTETEREVISEWAYNCERIMHGSPSGIDNATCTHGSVVQFRKGTRPRPLSLSCRVRVLLVDSRVSRQTRALVAAVAGLRQRQTPAVDHVLDAMGDIANAALQILQKLSSDKGEPDEEADYKQLAELWEMNHCLLAALGASHPALEAIRALAKQRGLAAKLTGAGGGGYAIVLIPPSTPRSTVDSLTSQLLENGFKVTETTLGGAGVRVEM